LFANLFKAVSFAEGDIVPQKNPSKLFLGGLLAVKDHVVQQRWRCGQAVAGGPEIVSRFTKPGLGFGYQNGIIWHKAEFLPG
jgi:hypothetical protein